MEEEKHQISSSDSDDEDAQLSPNHTDSDSDSDCSDSPEIPSGARTPEETTPSEKFGCPDDFIEISYESASDKGLFLEDVQKSSKELWLIKAPHNIDFDGLNDQQIILNAGQLITSKSSGGKKFDVIASEITQQSQGASTHALLPSRTSRRLAPGPVFKGQVTISESVAVPPVTLPPTLPKKVELPTGLKCRFVPFGYDEPFILPDSPPESPQRIPVKKEPGSSHKKKKKKSTDGKKDDSLRKIKDEPAGVRKKAKKSTSDTSSSEEHRKAHKRKIKTEIIETEESGVAAKKKKKKHK